MKNRAFQRKYMFLSTGEDFVSKAEEADRMKERKDIWKKEKAFGRQVTLLAFWHRRDFVNKQNSHRITYCPVPITGVLALMWHICSNILPHFKHLQGHEYIQSCFHYVILLPSFPLVLCQPPQFYQALEGISAESSWAKGWMILWLSLFCLSLVLKLHKAASAEIRVSLLDGIILNTGGDTIFLDIN